MIRKVAMQAFVRWFVRRLREYADRLEMKNDEKTEERERCKAEKPKRSRWWQFWR